MNRWLWPLTSVGLMAWGCAAGRGEGLDVAKLPEAVRADYGTFAQRCSKCHSLARPLQSGIVDESFWSMYVARMRRQPSSGITADDAVVILRFLNFYSAEQRAKKTGGT